MHLRTAGRRAPSRAEEPERDRAIMVGLSREMTAIVMMYLKAAKLDPLPRCMMISGGTAQESPYEIRMKKLLLKLAWK